MSLNAGNGRTPFGKLTRVLTLAAIAMFSTATAIQVTPAMAQVSTTFSRIDVAGNRRIEANTIRSIANLPTGRSVTPAEINTALQALFDSGLFESVEMVPQAGRLIIEVVENPTINVIAFEGNRRLDDDVLGTVVTLRPRRAYNAAAAEADALRIVEAYRASGRFSAEVNPVIIRRADNRVDLVFEVVEGNVTEVQRISFVGNRAFSDGRLRRAIDTGEAGIFSSLFSNDTYDASRVEFDKQLLREFYQERGYVDFQVRSVVSELSRERDGFFISFNISEGAQYTYGGMNVTSQIGNINPDRYTNNIDIRSGGVYSAQDVQDVVDRIALQLGEDGFPFADVAPRLARRNAQAQIDVEFEIVPTPRVFVERIDIEGNAETLDRVIRRQFDLVEGDPLNRRDVRRAEGKIRALNYFESVRVRVREGSAPDRAVIDVDVEERATGNLSFGLGFSSDSGVNGSISLTERNFLGRGQTVSTEVSVAEEARVLAFSFVEPSLLDRDVLGGISLAYRQIDRDESSFQQTNLSFRPRVAFPLSENGRLQVAYNLSNDEIRDVDDDASRLIKASEAITSSVEFSYTLDERNSPVDPSAGFQLRVAQEIAGLGGDLSFTKSTGTVKGYTSFFSEDLILSAELEAGVLNFQDDPSRITDRFSLGGDRLRGFARGGVGPRDAGDSLGGNMMAAARLEASFPIGLPEEYGIFGGVFYDVGSVWDLDDTDGTDGIVDDERSWRSAAGVSLFWSTPIGPLRFNWAWPIQEEKFDKTEDFRISIDTRF